MATKTPQSKKVKKSLEEASHNTEAKAAFAEYKKRMEALAAGMPGHFPPHPRNPFGNPHVHGPPPHAFYGHGMPGGPHHAHPATMPYAGWPGHHPAPPTVPFEGPQGSLAHSIGSMLRTGVDFINAGLGAGLQLLEGLSGQDSATCDCCCGDYPGFAGDCCGDHCSCGPDHFHHGCGCCCNPSVRNCP